MSVTTAPEASPGTQGVLAAVRQLTPTIKDRASDIEAARRLPGDLLRELKQAGCFRMLLPPSHGGSGVTLPDAMRVCAALGVPTLRSAGRS